MWVMLLVMAIAVASCRRASSPTSPSDSTTPAVSLTGSVTEAGAAALPNARVEVVEGVNHGTSAVADTQGHYALASLQPGSFSIRALADGFDADVRAVTVTSSETIDFALHRAAPGSGLPSSRWTVTGVMRDAGIQGPVAGARVEVREGKNQGMSATTDAGGRYTLSGLEGGTFALCASADGFAPQWRSVTLTSNQTVDWSLTRVASPPNVTGRTVDVVSSLGLPGVTVRIDGLGEAVTGSDGAFGLSTTSPQQVRGVTISSALTIDRTTRLRAPGPGATITLLPRSLDLTSFDQMFRGNGGELHRWVGAPLVVIERRVLQFNGVSDDAYIATSAVMSDAEVGSVLADLTWALPQLTGNTFNAFLEQKIETAAEGDLVTVNRPGAIVVARYEGLTSKTTFWGYTRWAWNGAGEMQAGIVMLDRGFDSSGSQYGRALRAHELGHALGYSHVTARASVMNTAAYLEPNAADRDGARIAFLRSPLNRTPDIDPDPLTINRRSVGGLVWKGDR